MDEGEEMDIEASTSKPTSTLLHIAVRKSDFGSACEFLEEMGYDVDTRDSNDETPLHIAAEFEHIDILRMLLSKGASVNVQNSQGDTPMHKAATSTLSDLVEDLLKYGGSVNIYNKEGYTPFHKAVSKGYKKVIELMLDWGARVHSEANKKQTPLHIAVTHWNCILAEILLDRGANGNARDCDGKTPLHLAVGRVDMTMTELLLERGADINAPDYDGQIPLHLAADHWNYRIVKMLLDRGSFINSQNNKGQTALHIAVNNGDLTLVNRLLDRGALTDTFDSHGLTPLQYAVNNDYAKLMLKLVSKGADVGVFSKDQYSCHNLSGPTLEVHIVKIQWAQLSESHDVETNDEHSKLKEMCLQELEKIKSMTVIDVTGKECSLVNILDRHRHFDMTTCRSFEVLLNTVHIDTEFPLYAFILKVSLLRMKKRHVFIRAAELFFDVHNFFNLTVSDFPTLPSTVRVNILRRLSYVDLQNLIVVTENTLRIKKRSSW